METEVEIEGTVCIIKVRGSIDALTAESLTAALHDLTEQPAPHLVVDFSGVDYTSSAGLRSILASVKEARQTGGDLRLAGANPNIRKMLDLSGFSNILKIYATTPEAVASFA